MMPLDANKGGTDIMLQDESEPPSIRGGTPMLRSTAQFRTRQAWRSGVVVQLVL
jgi:hypothetical protein